MLPQEMVFSCRFQVIPGLAPARLGVYALYSAHHGRLHPIIIASYSDNRTYKDFPPATRGFADMDDTLNDTMPPPPPAAVAQQLS